MEAIQKLRRQIPLEKLGQYSAITIALFGNVWIWKIYHISLIAFLFTVITFLALYLNTRKLLLMFIIVLCFTQLNFTNKLDLTAISNDQKRVQDMRLAAYPPRLLHVAYWLEVKPIGVALTRMQSNFFEALDINLYFFASYPRARVGFQEFEKFPYVFLPFFVVGIFDLLQKRKALLTIAILPPLSIITLYGTNVSGSIFALFPVMAYAIYLGLTKIAKKPLIPVLFVLCVLVLIQVISYEIY